MTKDTRKSAAAAGHKARSWAAAHVQPDPRRWTIAGWATALYFGSLSVVAIYFHDVLMPALLVAAPTLQAARWYSNRSAAPKV
jgi:hypothetical protein